MTDHGVEIWSGYRKSLVEARQKNAPMPDFQRVYAFVGLFDFRGVKINRILCYDQGLSVQDCRL
jgi:hypothetical protein